MPSPIKSPQIVDLLKLLAAAHGGLLLPELVVEAARSPTSPLHSHFEWDESVAAEKWRLHQARELISVVVHYLPGREKESPVKVFVSLSIDREHGGYRPLISVMSNDRQRAILLADAKREMESFRRKFGHLKELAEVVDVMNRVVSG